MHRTSDPAVDRTQRTNAAQCSTASENTNKPTEKYGRKSRDSPSPYISRTEPHGNTGRSLHQPDITPRSPGATGDPTTASTAAHSFRTGIALPISAAPGSPNQLQSTEFRTTRRAEGKQPIRARNSGPRAARRAARVQTGRQAPCFDRPGRTEWRHPHSLTDRPAHSTTEIAQHHLSLDGLPTASIRASPSAGSVEGSQTWRGHSLWSSLSQVRGPSQVWQAFCARTIEEGDRLTHPPLTENVHSRQINADPHTLGLHNT
jgi:hypothetical protein